MAIKWLNLNKLTSTNSYMIESLNEDKLKELFEQSRNSSRRRAIRTFQEDSYPGPQIGLNVIQPESYTRPHFRYSDEYILHYSGKLCFLVLDESGHVRRGQVLSKESPYLFLPAKAYHTLVSLEKDSALWFVTQGPFDPNNFRQDFPGSPTEKEDYAEYFDWLKKMALITEGLGRLKKEN